MQRISVGIGALAGAGAIALLTACSSSGSQNPNAAIPSASGAFHRSPLWRSGIASEYLGISRLPQTQFEPSSYIAPDKKMKSPADLFVDVDSPVEVLILKNKSWFESGTITSGITDPDGNWYDKHGLYVANYSAPNIEQYNSKGSLTFTYNAGMSSPVTLTTDSHGNVYEADFTGEAVNEYHQGSNSVVATCQPGGLVEGVAVDKSGDVFVAYYTGTGDIVEYKGGLSGCSATTLGATVTFPGGMVLDKKNDLVICDQTGDAVDIINPPYSSISGTLGTGYSEPFHVSLNKKNNQAYVTDTGTAHTIDVVSYPAGTRIATLGSSYGVADPFGAVDGSNFVP
jgi:hypothetical protein